MRDDLGDVVIGTGDHACIITQLTGSCGSGSRRICILFDNEASARRAVLKYGLVNHHMVTLPGEPFIIPCASILSVVYHPMEGSE